MRIGKILKIMFAVSVIALVVFVLIRNHMMNDESMLSTVSPTDSAISAYSDGGEQSFKTHKVPEDISHDGYYSAYALCYIEDEKELQLTARYNDSLTKNYIPDASEENFVWEIRDSEGKTVSTAKVYGTAEKYNYNYVRLIFSDVEPGGEDALYLQLVCTDCDYPDEGAKNLLIHSPQDSFKVYSLTEDEVKILKNKSSKK